MSEELRAEIARLRLRVAELEQVADRRGTIAVDRRREIARLRMTTAEREAVEWAAFEFDALRPDHGRAAERAATLRGLLERHKGGGK